jgi:hypothetical protein
LGGPNVPLTFWSFFIYIAKGTQLTAASARVLSHDAHDAMPRIPASTTRASLASERPGRPLIMQHTRVVCVCSRRGQDMPLDLCRTRFIFLNSTQNENRDQAIEVLTIIF